MFYIHGGGFMMDSSLRYAPRNVCRWAKKKKTHCQKTKHKTSETSVPKALSWLPSITDWVISGISALGMKRAREIMGCTIKLRYRGFRQNQIKQDFRPWNGSRRISSSLVVIQITSRLLDSQPERFRQICCRCRPCLEVLCFFYLWAEFQPVN